MARFIRIIIEKQAQGVYNGVYNIGSGHEVSIFELAKLIVKLTGLVKEPIFKPPRPGDIKRSRADIRKALTLSWNPQVPLRTELKN